MGRRRLYHGSVWGSIINHRAIVRERIAHLAGIRCHATIRPHTRRYATG